MSIVVGKFIEDKVIWYIHSCRLVIIHLIVFSRQSYWAMKQHFCFSVYDIPHISIYLLTRGWCFIFFFHTHFTSLAFVIWQVYLAAFIFLPDRSQSYQTIHTSYNSRFPHFKHEPTIIISVYVTKNWFYRFIACMHVFRRPNFNGNCSKLAFSFNPCSPPENK